LWMASSSMILQAHNYLRIFLLCSVMYEMLVCQGSRAQGQVAGSWWQPSYRNKEDMCSQVIYGAFLRVASWKQSRCFACLVESWQLLKSLHLLVLDAEIISTLQQRIHGDSTDATSSTSDEEEKWRRSCSATHGPTDLHLTYLQSVIVESSLQSQVYVFQWLIWICCIEVAVCA
jgi:hypothetical protein